MLLLHKNPFVPLTAQLYVILLTALVFARDTITHASDQTLLRACKGWEVRKTRRRHNAKELSCQLYL